MYLERWLLGLCLSLFIHLVAFQLEFDADPSPSSRFGKAEVGLFRVSSLVRPDAAFDSRNKPASSTGRGDLGSGDTPGSSIARVAQGSQLKPLIKPGPRDAAKPLQPLKEKLVSESDNVDGPGDASVAKTGDRTAPQSAAAPESKTAVDRVIAQPQPPSSADPLSELMTVNEGVGQQQATSSGQLEQTASLETTTIQKPPSIIAPQPRSERNQAPRYPYLALRNGWQGQVILEVAVARSGLVQDVSVTQSSGYVALDSAAVNAVKDWQFVPAQMDDVNVEGRAVVPINFVLP